MWWWKRWRMRVAQSRRSDADFKYKKQLYQEVTKSRKEWEQAYYAFEAAVGSDEVDVAIYTLEAAERRYQIKLKTAKAANLNWNIYN